PPGCPPAPSSPESAPGMSPDPCVPSPDGLPPLPDVPMPCCPLLLPPEPPPDPDPVAVPDPDPELVLPEPGITEPDEPSLAAPVLPCPLDSKPLPGCLSAVSTGSAPVLELTQAELEDGVREDVPEDCPEPAFAPAVADPEAVPELRVPVFWCPLP